MESGYYKNNAVSKLPLPMSTSEESKVKSSRAKFTNFAELPSFTKKHLINNIIKAAENGSRPPGHRRDCWRRTHVHRPLLHVPSQKGVAASPRFAQPPGATGSRSRGSTPQQPDQAPFDHPLVRPAPNQRCSPPRVALAAPGRRHHCRGPYHRPGLFSFFYGPVEARLQQLRANHHSSNSQMLSPPC